MVVPMGETSGLALDFDLDRLLDRFLLAWLLGKMISRCISSKVRVWVKGSALGLTPPPPPELLSLKMGLRKRRAGKACGVSNGFFVVKLQSSVL